MNVAIVVPCYNESSRWQPDYWRKMLSIDGTRWVFVDDGSTDDTHVHITASSREGASGVLRFARNRGKAEAVRAGLLQLLSEDQSLIGVGFLDADGAFDVGDIRRLLDTFRQRATEPVPPDALWSSRIALSGRNIRRTLFRHYVGRVVSTIVSLGEPELPYDTQSGFKVFAPSKTLAACLEEPFDTRWFFELEILARWRMFSTRPMIIWEEPLASWQEIGGSRLGLRSVLVVLRELVIVKRLQRQSRRATRQRKNA